MFISGLAEAGDLEPIVRYEDRDSTVDRREIGLLKAPVTERVVNLVLSMATIGFLLTLIVAIRESWPGRKAAVVVLSVSALCSVALILALGPVEGWVPALGVSGVGFGVLGVHRFQMMRKELH